MNVEISAQVAEFVRCQPPEARRRLRLALRRLVEERGDLRALEGPLKGFYRLRAGTFRVVFAYGMERGTPTIRCLFAERRGVVYDTFSEMLKEHLLRRSAKNQ